MASAEIESTPQKEPLFWPHLFGWFRSIPRTALLSMVGPSLLLLLGYFGWLYYGAPHYENAVYGIKKENVLLTQPDWIRTSVTDDVFRVSGLDHVSVNDNQAAVVIARAFDAHPTIRKTQRVQLVTGGQILVKAEFRTPVAMVHCEGDEGSSFLPVDRDGVLLPRDHFTEEDVLKYIWIYMKGVKESDDRLEGRRFGDVRIEQAASLCAYLEPYRERAMITRVNVSMIPNKSGWNFVLETSGGSKDRKGPIIFWGCALGQEGITEPAPQVKLSRLLDAASNRTVWSSKSIDLSKTVSD